MHAELGIAELERVRAGIAPYIVQTPSRRWEGGSLADRIGAGTVVEVKLELFQRTGTFKARGAINTMLNLDAAQRARGVTAVSAGNHAVATAWAAQQLGAAAALPRRHASASAVAPEEASRASSFAPGRASSASSSSFS